MKLNLLDEFTILVLSEIRVPQIWCFIIFFIKISKHWGKSTVFKQPHIVYNPNIPYDFRMMFGFQQSFFTIFPALASPWRKLQGDCALFCLLGHRLDVKYRKLERVPCWLNVWARGHCFRKRTMGRNYGIDGNSWDLMGLNLTVGFDGIQWDIWWLNPSLAMKI